MTALLVTFAVIGIIIFWLVGIYNSLVNLRVNTENARSQIDIQLKRRHDLIPNLVETVKGYAKHENETLEEVIQARNMAVSLGKDADLAKISSAENLLTGALKSLFAVSEAYPDLKANTNFLELQEELTSTENRISFARQHYNDAVSSYNTKTQVFPSNVIATSFHFKSREFFELDKAEIEAVKQTPTVNF